MPLISKVMDYDADLRRTRIHHFDPDTEQATIETVQDVEDIVECAKADFNRHSDYRPFSHGVWFRAGTIPLATYGAMCRNGMIHDKKAILEWLQNPDHQKFKTIPGRLI